MMKRLTAALNQLLNKNKIIHRICSRLTKCLLLLRILSVKICLKIEK